jgi:hypothetical protein
VQSCADTTHTRTVMQAIWMERSRYDDNVRVYNSSLVYTVYIRTTTFVDQYVHDDYAMFVHAPLEQDADPAQRA